MRLVKSVLVAMLLGIMAIQMAWADNSALLMALEKRDFNAVKSLVEQGADIESKNNEFGINALLAASITGDVELVRALVEARDTFLFFFTIRKVNINAKNKKGATAIDMASSNAIMALLRSNGAKFPLER